MLYQAANPSVRPDRRTPGIAEGAVVPSLPNNPDLESFRRQARDLQRAVRSGSSAAIGLVQTHHPGAGPANPRSFPLRAAQLVVARSYGFSSWPHLRHYLEVAAPLRRDPTAPIDRGTPAGNESAADEVCRSVCLVYSDQDGPERWAHGMRLLRERPALGSQHIFAAAAVGDPHAIAAHLRGDPALADTQGGPHRWTPLMYLAYSRAGVGSPAQPWIDAVGCLLDTGADPNTGYLWQGLPSPFTVLTGLFGEGEQGPGRQPRHPHAQVLARLLLARGANPNDGQALYNRMFRSDDSHLRLLFEFGLGRGDVGDWTRRLGEALETPAQMLARQLDWAIDHGFGERVTLLAANGVDIRARRRDGRTPAERAAATGDLDIVERLVAAGAARPVVTDEARLLFRLLRADGEPRPDPRTDPGPDPDPEPELLDGARHRHPDLIHRASTERAVERVARAGFDVDARRDGATALHNAAWSGNLPLIVSLLAAGANPGLLDDRFSSTALGWAQHAYQGEALALLTAATAHGGPG